MKSFILTILLCTLCFSICLFNFDNQFTDLLGALALLLGGWFTFILMVFTDEVNAMDESYDIDLKDFWIECNK